MLFTHTKANYPIGKQVSAMATSTTSQGIQTSAHHQQNTTKSHSWMTPGKEDCHSECQDKPHQTKAT